MKSSFYILIAVIFSINYVHAQFDEMPESFKKPFLECMADIGMTGDDFKTAVDYDDSKMRCFFACLMKKQGVLVDGKIPLDKGIEVFVNFHGGADDATKQKVIECMNKANEYTDECEVAGVVHKCEHEAGLM